MGKASLKKSNIEAAQSIATHQTTPQITEPAFSSGDLGQLQEILFGQQQRSTNEQLCVLHKQFNEQLSTLSNVLNSRLNQLTDKVEKYQTNFDNRLSEIKTNSESAFENMSQTIGATKAELQTDINTLKKSSNKDIKRLDADLAQYESKLLNNINDTKEEIQTGLNHSIHGLHCTKLDKQDLAELLNDVSEKLANPTVLVKK